MKFDESNENQVLLINFLSAKRIEGCSERTIIYYKTTIFKMLDSINLKIENITADDLRKYLSGYKNQLMLLKQPLIILEEFFQVFSAGLKMKTIF